jgi:hypothetical protein
MNILLTDEEIDKALIFSLHKYQSFPRNSRLDLIWSGNHIAEVQLKKDLGTIHKMREALEALLKRYVQLVDSGDAGFWNPEEEDVVINARQALLKEVD